MGQGLSMHATRHHSRMFWWGTPRYYIEKGFRVDATRFKGVSHKTPLCNVLVKYSKVLYYWTGFQSGCQKAPEMTVITFSFRFDAPGCLLFKILETTLLGLISVMKCRRDHDGESRDLGSLGLGNLTTTHRIGPRGDSVADARQTGLAESVSMRTLHKHTRSSTTGQGQYWHLYTLCSVLTFYILCTLNCLQ